MKLEIEYINNTCDTKGLGGFGEIMVILKDGKPVTHHDYSDDPLDLRYVGNILGPFGIDLHLKPINNPPKKLIEKVREYLVGFYGEPYDE